MAGPWEEYQPAAAPPGPWTEFQAPVPAAPGPKEAQNIGDSIVAGLQDSSLGLAIRGELPDQVLGENAPWYMRLGMGVGAVAGDFVPGVVGAVAGAPGGPVGMMAGGFAAPMALRDALIEAYSNDYASSWEGVWEIAKAAVTGGAKGAVIGAATMGAGKVAAPLLKPLGKVTAGVGTFGAELGALTTTAAALEGQLPTWQNFMDNALLLGGMKGAVRTAKHLMGIWAETGKTPEQVVADAQKDPALKAKLLQPEPTAFEKAEAATAAMRDGKPLIPWLEGLRYGTGLDEAAAMFGVETKPGKSYLTTQREIKEKIGPIPTTNKPSHPYLDTRGQGRQYHGSSRAIQEIQEFTYNDKNIYGQGFYTTDAVDVAVGYTAKGSGKDSALYVVTEKTPVKTLNAEAPIPTYLREVAVGLDNSLVDVALDAKPKSVRAFYDEIRAESKNEGYSTDSVQELFDVFREAHLANGYGGMSHAGGLNTGAAKHTVKIYFDPKNQLLVEPIGADKFLRPTIPHGESLPEPYKALALDERIKASVAADARPEQMREILGAKEPPKLGELPIKDPVKYEYITDQDTLKGTLRLVESFYQPEIQTQTRGVVTNKATAAEALKMVAEGDVAEHVVGTAENAAQIYARAHVLKGVTQNAYNKVRALAGIPEADLTPRMKLESLAALEQLSMVLAEYRGARAEAGRALQVFNKIKRDSSLIGDAETLIKLAERKGSLQDIAALAGSLKDPVQMQKFAEEYTKATKTEMVLEGWKAAILSGYETHLANMMGNSTKWLVELPESVVAATLTAAQRAAAKDPLSMAQFKARAFAPLYGLQHGARDSLTVAAEVWRQKGEHLEKADVYKSAIPGKAGEVIRTPFRLLQVEDALFRTVAERAEAHIMAVDRVTKEGLHPETAEGRAAIVRYTMTPEAGLSAKDGEAAIQAVQQAGAEAVFSQRLGPRLETVQRAMAGHPIGFVVPFFRTPVNLISWAVQHTPGMNFMSGRWRDDYAAGGERRNRALARVTIGTALSMTAFQMAQEGLITGGGSVDPEQRRTKAGAGWQPYSFLVDGKYYSYQRMEPVAKVMGIAADLTEIMEATKDPEDKAKIASMLVLLFGNATVSTTYLSGLSNMMNGLLDPERYGESIMEQYASSVVPKVVGQTAATIDPDKREVDGVLDAIQSQIPILREKLLPQRDVWGEARKNEKLFAVMPVAVSEKSQDKVKTEAMRLQIAISDAPKYVTEKGPFNPSDKRIELTGEQRDIMKQVTGKQAMTILAPIVNSPDWERIPDFAKAEIYKKVITGARKSGAYAALPPDDAARMQMREKIVNEIIRQTQEAEGK